MSSNFRRRKITTPPSIVKPFLKSSQGSKSKLKYNKHIKFMNQLKQHRILKIAPKEKKLINLYFEARKNLRSI